MFRAYGAGKQHRRVRESASVGESARGAAFKAPACARGRCQTPRQSTGGDIHRAHETDELAPRRGAPLARIDRARRAHHHVRDLTINGVPDLAELQDEQSILGGRNTERRIHFGTAGPGDARENAATAKLLPKCGRGWCVTGLRKAYFGARRSADHARMALSRCVDDAHSLRDDPSVDGDRACMRPLLGALAPDASGGELSPLSGGKARGAAGQGKEGKMSKEMAHLELEAGAGTRDGRRRRLGG